MWDFVASSGEVAFCSQLNIPPLILPFQGCRRAYSGCKTCKNEEGPAKSWCLVCSFWATVKTWPCNKAEPVLEDLIPLHKMLILKSLKHQDFIFRWLYTNEIIHMNITFHFGDILQIDPLNSKHLTFNFWGCHYFKSNYFTENSTDRMRNRNFLYLYGGLKELLWGFSPSTIIIT